MMASGRALCFTCNKENAKYCCDGCSHRFCLPHLQEHRQMVNAQLDKITNEHDQLKQTISEYKQNPTNLSLIGQIDQWEKTSIETIKRTALECRETVQDQTRRVIDETEKKLGQFASQLKGVRKENEFYEINLQRLTNKLMEMRKELTEPFKIVIREQSQRLIDKIYVSLSNLTQRQESKSHKCKQHANTIAGGNGYGQRHNQLSRPAGISVDHNKTILIADHDNHRIVRWEWQANKGTVIAGENGPGNRMDQLNGPTDVIVDKQNHSIIIADQGNRRVIRWLDQSQSNQQILFDSIHCGGLAMDKEGFLYVSNYGEHEVRRWKVGERKGTLVAGGNGEGNQLNQLNGPTYLFVDDQESVYVSDSSNHRVMKWQKSAKEGVIVAGGNGDGDNLSQLSYPCGVVVDRVGYIYVADQLNHRVMRWREGEREGEIVFGGYSEGQRSNQVFNPNGLSMDDERNLYVADWGNHRIQMFDLILS